jgi:hypothetical protein
MEETLSFTGDVKPLFAKRGNLPEKYRNPSLKGYSGKCITAKMVGCTTYKNIGAVITYSFEGKKIYDVMDFPGNTKEVNDERKQRYMRMFGTKGKTIATALSNPLSFSSSIGAIWGNKIRLKKKDFEAVLHVHTGGWLELVDGWIV